ncbi:MAG: hypothetical protein N2Z23_07640 [Pyrinomonadaceae bacterium]|nr:hypothetical protein [Pyrinomonadaceae bacterium]
MNSKSKKHVYVLGISGKYGLGGAADAHHPAAALLKDGEIVAMGSEERFVRVKYAIGFFPYHSIKFCLDTAGISLEDLDAIAWSNNPYLATERWIKANNTFIKNLAYSFAKMLKRSKNGIKKGLTSLIFRLNLG